MMEKVGVLPATSGPLSTSAPSCEVLFCGCRLRRFTKCVMKGENLDTTSETLATTLLVGLPSESGVRNG